MSHCYQIHFCRVGVGLGMRPVVHETIRTYVVTGLSVYHETMEQISSSAHFLSTATQYVIGLFNAHREH